MAWAYAPSVHNWKTAVFRFSACPVFAQHLLALSNPKTSVLTWKCHPYIGNLKSGTSVDSKTAFPHCGDVLVPSGHQSLLLAFFLVKLHVYYTSQALHGARCKPKHSSNSYQHQVVSAETGLEKPQSCQHASRLLLTPSAALLWSVTKA